MIEIMAGERPRDDVRFSLTEADWAGVLAVADLMREPDDGGCFIVVRIAAALFLKRGVEMGRMGVMSLRTDDRLDHAWLTIDGLPVHAPYVVPEEYQLRIEREGEVDWKLTGLLRRELQTKFVAN